MLIDDNPQQQQRVAQIITLVNQKLEELAVTIELHRSGRTDAALAHVQTNQGKQIMDEIRVVTRAMIAVENKLLEYRKIESSQIYSFSTWIVYGGSAFILFMAALIAQLTSTSISEEYTQLQQAEKSLSAANQTLIAKTAELEQSNQEISTFEYRVEKEKEKIYVAAIHGAQHVTNNLLNQLMLVQRAIEKPLSLIKILQRCSAICLMKQNH